MRPFRIIMDKFVRGEISPLSIFTTIKDYFTGLKQLKDFYVHPTGYLVKRPPLVIDNEQNEQNQIIVSPGVSAPFKAAFNKDVLNNDYSIHELNNITFLIMKTAGVLFLENGVYKRLVHYFPYPNEVRTVFNLNNQNANTAYLFFNFYFDPFGRVFSLPNFEFVNTYSNQKYTKGVFSMGYPRSDFTTKFDKAKIIGDAIYVPTSLGVMKIIKAKDSNQHYFCPFFVKEAVGTPFPKFVVENPQNVFPIAQESLSEITGLPETKSSGGEEYTLTPFFTTAASSRNDFNGFITSYSLPDADAVRSGARRNLGVFQLAYVKTNNLSDRTFMGLRNSNSQISSGILGLNHFLIDSTIPLTIDETIQVNNALEGRDICLVATNEDNDNAYHRFLIKCVNPFYDKTTRFISTMFRNGLFRYNTYCSYLTIPPLINSSGVDTLNSNTYRTIDFSLTSDYYRAYVYNQLRNIEEIASIDQRLVFIDEDGRIFLSGIGNFEMENVDFTSLSTIDLSDSSQIRKSDIPKIKITRTPDDPFNFSPIFEETRLNLTDVSNYNNDLIFKDNGIFRIRPTNFQQALGLTNLRVEKLLDEIPASNIFNINDLLIFKQGNALVTAKYERNFDRLVVDDSGKLSDHLLLDADDYIIHRFIPKDNIYLCASVKDQKLIMFTHFKPRSIGGFSEIRLPKGVTFSTVAFNNDTQKLELTINYNTKNYKATFDYDASLYADLGIIKTDLNDDAGVIINNNKKLTKDQFEALADDAICYVENKSYIETLPLVSPTGDGNLGFMTPKKIIDMIVASSNMNEYSIGHKTYGENEIDVLTEVPTVNALNILETRVQNHAKLLRHNNTAVTMGNDLTIQLEDKSLTKSVIKSLQFRGGNN